MLEELYLDFLFSVMWMPTSHKLLQAGTQQCPMGVKELQLLMVMWYLRYAERAIRMFQSCSQKVQTGPSQLSLKSFLGSPAFFVPCFHSLIQHWSEEIPLLPAFLLGQKPQGLAQPHRSAHEGLVACPPAVCLPWAVPSAVTCPGLSYTSSSCSTMAKPTMDDAEQDGNPSGSNCPS